MKIIVKALERSVPNDIRYWSERLASFEVEADETELAFDAKDGLEAIAKIRRLQEADLDDQTRSLARKFDTPMPRKATPVEEPTTAQTNELRHLVGELTRYTGSTPEIEKPETRQAADLLLRAMRAKAYDAKTGVRA